jgi:2-dehydropantoate 2-reductase
LALKKAFDKAGFKNIISDNIVLDIWRKFLFITTYSGIGALTRQPLGAIIEIPFIKQYMYDTALEIKQIANIKNIDITPVDIEKTMHILNTMPYDTTASMQRDIMAGKPSELDNFNGYIVKESVRLHAKTPCNNFIYYTLLPLENFARKNV